MEPPSYASVWNRFLAYWIDTLVLNIAFSLAALLAIPLGMANPLASSLFIGLVWVLALLYMPLMHASSQQATVGKLLLGLRVTGPGGIRLSYVRALLRFVVKVLSILFIVPLFFIFFSSKKHALHDKAAGSSVIDREREGEQSYRLARRVAAIFFVLSLLFGVMGLFFFGSAIVAAVSGIQSMTLPEPTRVEQQVQTYEANGVHHFSFQSHWEYHSPQPAQTPSAPSIGQASDATEGLFDLAKGGRDDDYAVMRLIVRGADVNARDAQGRTPLFYAVQQHHLEMVKALVFKGADTGVTDREGVSIRKLAEHDRSMQRALRYGRAR